MEQNRILTAVLSPLANFLHRRFYKRPFTQPQKAIILQPGTIGDVMLCTPMLSLLRREFPHTRFDWAISQHAYLVVSGNNDITNHLIVPTKNETEQIDAPKLVQVLKEAQYDTCFVPDNNVQMAQIAVQAQIPQRIGFWNGGKGYTFTTPVHAPTGERHRAAINVALAQPTQRKVQLTRLPMAFYPSDQDRKLMSERLIDELDWMGDRLLVMINPGVGNEEDDQRWPIERFVLLGNRIIRNHQAQLVLVGDKSDSKIAKEVAGMIAGSVPNWVGRVTVGQIAALAEVADLYIGCDCGATHIAATMGCATLAIFGPTDPSVSGPYHPRESQVVVLHKTADEERPFSWDDGVTVAQAESAVRKLLSK